MVLSRFPRLAANLPLFNCVVASSALGFQVFVLFPWHHEIDRSHHKLAQKVEALTKSKSAIDVPVVPLPSSTPILAPNIIEPTPTNPIQSVVVANLGSQTPKLG
eukprot:gene9648-11830_t